MRLICLLFLALPVMAGANVEYFKHEDPGKVRHVKIIYMATVSGYTIKDLILTLDEVNSNYPNVKDVALYINSQGGDFFSGQMAVEAIKSSRIPVRTINYGMVASAASLIYCAATVRESMPTGFFVLHPASTTLSGDYRPDTLRNEKDVLDHVESVLKSTYKTCTNYTDDDIDRIIHSDGTRAQLTAEESVAAGLTSTIIHSVALSDDTFIITDDK